MDKYVISDSESEENVEDLLLEYQRYLDKAHKQRINYIQKSQGKNKVPMKYREKYTKMKPSSGNKYDAYDDYYNNMKDYQSTFTEPLSLFMSQEAKFNTFKKPEFIKSQLQDYKETNSAKSLFKTYPTISNLQPISNCYCKANEIPCKCPCKQCIVLNDSLPIIMNLNPYDNQNIVFESFPKTSKHTLANNDNKISEGNLNILIKIDVQLPKILTDLIHKFRNKDKKIEGETIKSKETISTIRLPFPYLNFPFPLNILGNQKIHNKHDNSAIHKIRIHKKKKSRFSNNNKKRNQGKKFITFHSIKEPLSHNITKEINEITKKNSTDFLDKDIEETKAKTNKSFDEIVAKNDAHNNTLTDPVLKTANDTIETIYLTVNMTNNDNDTKVAHTLDNSIETEFIEKDNKTTVEPIRLKREALDQIIKTMSQNNTNTSMVTGMTPSHKLSKMIAGEMELLYWPTDTKNVKLVKSKNITALILERETKKSKLNMTHDKIRSDRTIALEQAIFGDVDWDDVDTVAPVFMSFVGKYLRGVLTFCSQNVCHSMKCSDKMCHHRICKPENRFNYKGHCTGNNDTGKKLCNSAFTW